MTSGPKSEAAPAGMAHVVVMAKAPTAGLAKTRLAPVLGAEGAAGLAEQLLDHAVAQAVAAGLGGVTLWATPDTRHPAFVRLQAQHGVALATQVDGDLGRRMADAFTSTFEQHHGAVLLMGTDLPGLTAATLQAAAAQLVLHDAVFVPALDGGYGLVGLRPCTARTLRLLFDDMQWSQPQVMAQTRLRLAAAGLRHGELPAVADIDTADDLIHLPAGWLGSTAPR